MFLDFSMGVSSIRTGYFLFLLLVFISTGLKAQIDAPTIVRGRVVDAVTNEPLPLVAVVFYKTTTGTTTDFNGDYYLAGKKISNVVRYSCLGYETLEVTVLTGKNQVMDIRLKPAVQQLNELVVKPEKKRYRNKDNPAVELIRKVIERKELNRSERFNTLAYEKYDKTQFALSNITEEFKNKKYLRKFKFIFENSDTTKMPGKEILPMYLKETLTQYYLRKSPSASRTIVQADKMVKFEGYLDEQGVTAYLKYMYQDIDLYRQDITFLTNNFLSPIAGTAPTFYRYFIMDTVDVEGTRCYKMLFAPRNKTDMLFQGFLFITTDSTYALRRAEMSVPADINLNWAKEVRIVQDFSYFGSKGWALTRDLIGIDFGITRDRMGIYGERLVNYSNYQMNEPLPDSIFQGPVFEEVKGYKERDDQFWNTRRHVPLTKSESGTYSMIDSLQQIPAFRNFMNISMLLIAGYRDLGNFEIGPINTFYSYNPVEGYRVRVGGRTTPKLITRAMFETYVAYGFTDKQVKYYLGGTFSLTDHTIWEFPVKSLKLSYHDETKIPGQELQFVQEDNFLLSIKRGVNNKLLYNKSIRFEHLNEFRNHFSYNIAYQFLRQRPGGDLYFNTVDYMLHVNDPAYIDISEVSLTLRYAPNEKFYQGKQFRFPMASKYPVTQLQLSYGADFMGNDFTYLNAKLTMTKRFYFSIFGYTDMVFEAGKIFGKVSYPLLFIHRANQTYSYQIASYNLMNFLEFVSDEYTSLNIDHCFSGFFLNKIPLLKKLKWREHASAKFLFGNLTRLNDPASNADLFRLPEDPVGPVTFTLRRGPYIEVSGGIGNILKFFRVEFVSRLTYLDQPNVARYGIRIRFKLDF